MMVIMQQKRHCFIVGYGTSGAMAKMNLMLFLEQLFQRFLLFDGDNAILLFIGVDAPTNHQFYDITDAAVVAIGNSTNLVNKFSVADGIKAHPVCSFCSHRRRCGLCRILIYVASTVVRGTIRTL